MRGRTSDGTSEATDAHTVADVESIVGLEGFRERADQYADRDGE